MTLMRQGSMSLKKRKKKKSIGNATTASAAAALEEQKLQRMADLEEDMFADIAAPAKSKGSLKTKAPSIQSHSSQYFEGPSAVKQTESEIAENSAASKKMKVRFQEVKIQKEGTDETSSQDKAEEGTAAEKGSREKVLKSNRLAPLQPMDTYGSYGSYDSDDEGDLSKMDQVFIYAFNNSIEGVNSPCVFFFPSQVPDGAYCDFVLLLHPLSSLRCFLSAVLFLARHSHAWVFVCMFLKRVFLGPFFSSCSCLDLPHSLPCYDVLSLLVQRPRRIAFASVFYTFFFLLGWIHRVRVVTASNAGILKRRVNGRSITRAVRPIQNRPSSTR